MIGMCYSTQICSGNACYSQWNGYQVQDSNEESSTEDDNTPLAQRKTPTDPNQLTGIPMGLREQKFLSLIYWKIEIKNTIISKFQISCVKIPCFHGEPENGYLADFGRRQRFLDLNLCTKMHSFTFGHKTLISCVIFIILAEILSLVGFRCI